MRTKLTAEPETDCARDCNRTHIYTNIDKKVVKASFSPTAEVVLSIRLCIVSRKQVDYAWKHRFWRPTVCLIGDRHRCYAADRFEGAMVGVDLLNEDFMTVIMGLLYDQRYLWGSDKDTFSEDGTSEGP